MKVNNIEKFRQNIINALKECYTVKEYQSIGLNEQSAHEAMQAECGIYDYKSPTMECIALYKPIEVSHWLYTSHSNKKLYMVVCEDSIRIYSENDKEYKLDNILFHEAYNNRLAYMVVLVNNINYLLDK